jgi:CheY-like chemotaxis protein
MAKILYVDDHPDSREIMTLNLKASGFEVDFATDGLEGVNKAKEWLPNLILMDLRMPRMDGFEAIAAIRAEPTTAHIPIIVTSAWANAKHKQHSLDVGANEHFSKPVDMRYLLIVIKRYLDKFHSAK